MLPFDWSSVPTTKRQHRAAHRNLRVAQCATEDTLSGEYRSRLSFCSSMDAPGMRLWKSPVLCAHRRARCSPRYARARDPSTVHPWTHQVCVYRSHRACASMDTQEMRLRTHMLETCLERCSYASMDAPGAPMGVIGPVRPWKHRKCVYGSHQSCAPIDAQGVCLWKSSGLCIHGRAGCAPMDTRALLCVHRRTIAEKVLCVNEHISTARWHHQIQVRIST